MLTHNKKFFLTTALVVLCDGFSKRFIAEQAAPGLRVEVFSFLDIVHYKNTGIAFGMLQNLGHEARFVLYAVSLAAAVIFGAVFLRRASRGAIFAAFIVGGAIGNSIDRFAFGYVTDFIEFHWFASPALRWPAFNFADFFITVGAGGLLFLLMRREERDVHGNS